VRAAERLLGLPATWGVGISVLVVVDQGIFVGIVIVLFLRTEEKRCIIRDPAVWFLVIFLSA